MIASLPISAEVQERALRPLHVLTLTPFYPVQDDDAQGCFVAEPLSWVQQLGVDNTVIAVRPFYHDRPRSNQSAVPARWSRYFSLPGGSGLPTAGTFLCAQIRRHVRRLHATKSIDLIHAHAPLPCGHAAALLSHELEIPFVVTVHGLDAFSTRQVKGSAGRWCRHRSRRVFAAARQVICVSKRVQGCVAEGNEIGNSTVVYNGVDTLMFSPGEQPAESDVVLSVGNLIPIKGHQLLLQAFAAIHHRFPRLSCQIIGDGPEEAGLRALATRLGIAGKTCFLGRRSRSQVAAAMRACTIFALPSRYEGLGCVYLEAMAAAKPVVGCRGQGIEEVIHHGSNGLLVGPGDLDGLTRALSALLQDQQRRQQMGDAARRTVVNGFTLSHQADGLARIYRECVA